MKIFKNKFFLHTIYYLLPAVLLGCAGVKEMGKGFLGVSTKVLEDNRKDALSKELNYDLNASYLKIKMILINEKVHIYSDDLRRHILALYISDEDTTPVGIFFTEKDKDATLIEISSPSIYGKEHIFKVISDALKNESTKAKEKGITDAT